MTTNRTWSLNMTENSKPEDAEFSPMQNLYVALEPLETEARSRVVGYVVARLGINLRASALRSNDEKEPPSIAAEVNRGDDTKRSYASLAELFDSTQPTSNADKALVAGYWLQVCQGAETFDGQSANKELKHLGHGLANITNAVDSLKGQKPALALQLKKSGTTQQARKVYKITAAGLKAVEDMISE
jgi:hypothetical protein